MIDPRMQMLAALGGQPQMPVAQGPENAAMSGLFGLPPQALMKMAGDVVPLPIQPGPMSGKPPLAEIVQGQKDVRAGSPLVVNHPGRDDWYNRTKIRLEMPGR